MTIIINIINVCCISVDGFRPNSSADYSGRIQDRQLHLLEHHALLIHFLDEGAVESLQIVLSWLSFMLSLIRSPTGAEGLPLY
jgi:hypothetical protein